MSHLRCEGVSVRVVFVVLGLDAASNFNGKFRLVRSIQNSAMVGVAGGAIDESEEVQSMSQRRCSRCGGATGRWAPVVVVVETGPY